MFQDYSITNASRSRASSNPPPLDDCVSPTSSRSASPMTDDFHSNPFLDAEPMTELSYRFEQHCLQSPSKLSYELSLASSNSTFSDLRLPPTSPRIAGRMRSTQSRLPWRQSYRHRYTPAYLSSISAFVNEMHRDCDDASLAVCSTEYNSDLFSISSDPLSYIDHDNAISTSSEDSGSDCFKSSKKPSNHRISKNPRQPNSLADTTAGKQTLVMKKVRMRRNAVSFKNARAGEQWRSSQN